MTTVVIMSKNHFRNEFVGLELTIDQLLNATGGAAVDAAQLAQIEQQARQYCPATVAKYASVDPSTVTRESADAMANSCLGEMGKFKAMIARPKIEQALNKAFSK